MVVVADASPLHYLILIGEVDLLRLLFGRVVMPDAVLAELTDKGTPDVVRRWVDARPEWLTVAHVISDPLSSLADLDRGERDAIQLAMEQMEPTLLLIDETKGRRAAQALQLAVVGTTGLLERGARLKCVDLTRALTRLQATNFRISPRLLAETLGRNPA